MVDKEVLIDLWWKLANLCWRHGLVPSVWRQGTVVPVPKKKSKGICEADNFRGIALVSVVYKVMCAVVQERVVQICNSKQLLTEEQGGGGGVSEGEGMQRPDSVFDPVRTNENGDK